LLDRCEKKRKRKKAPSSHNHHRPKGGKKKNKKRFLDAQGGGEGKKKKKAPPLGPRIAEGKGKKRWKISIASWDGKGGRKRFTSSILDPERGLKSPPWRKEGTPLFQPTEN